MSGPWHPTGRAPVSSRFPAAQGTCDRCGGHYALTALRYQFQWSGMLLQNLQLRVCRECLDVPQVQLRTIIIPPDPIPVPNPRPEQYAVEMPSFLMAEDGSGLLTEDGQAILWEITDTPTPDPNNPALYP